MKIKSILLTTPALALLFFVSSCSKSNYGGGGQQPPPPPPGDNSITINIYNMQFPASTTVKKGTIVKWYNQDGFAHTVTSDDGSTFNSGNLGGGATFSYTASQTGTFLYHCNIHADMHGKLIVTE